TADPSAILNDQRAVHAELGAQPRGSLRRCARRNQEIGGVARRRVQQHERQRDDEPDEHERGDSALDQVAHRVIMRARTPASTAGPHGHGDPRPERGVDAAPRRCRGPVVAERATAVAPHRHGAVYDGGTIASTARSPDPRQVGRSSSVGRPIRLAFLCGAATVGLLASCAPPPENRGTVVYASGADLESANPLVTVHPMARQVQRYALFVTLARLDSMLEPQPYLARRWT